ncbi:membrane protein [Jeotgalibacillus soli]|uniref:Membrane protein n=2 Tax=Jeotgalibacillus soli TaxID=889306 RepID=A0A0C2W0R9_9BACL|nr:membrane protein [Jeotgalibacillus soli]
MVAFGQQALLSMLIHLVFIALSFWALQALRIDKALKPNRVMQARVLLILLSIAIGSSVANFFLSYSTWSQQLPLLW